MQAVPHVRIDLSPLDAVKRRGHWQEIMPTHRVEVPDEDGSGRPAVINSWLLGQIAIGQAQTSGMRLRRSRADIMRDQIDHYAFSINAGGEWAGEAGDRDFAVVGRGVFVMDMAQPMRADIRGMDNVQIVIPRDLLDAAIGARNLHGLTLHGGAQSLLHDHILSLQRNLPRLTIADAPDVARATLALLAAATRPSADTLAEAAPVIDSLLLVRARRFIRSHLRDASLNAETISRGLGISRSRLYLLFRPFGGVSAYIQDRRLAQIHADLAQGLDRRMIHEIAASFGFSQAAHFSRVFREKYGISATELRRGEAATSLPREAAKANAASTVAHWMQSLAAHP
jgi:AraC-like DNA-binding protein